MSRRRKLVVAAGVGAAALAVASLGAAGAIAASRAFSGDERSKAVIEDAAKQLGVEPSELSDALRQALENQIDEAVEAGKLSKEQADRLKERLESSDYPHLFGGFGGPHRSFGHGFHGFWRGGPFLGGFDILETAASYLGMTEADLREELRDSTLAEIAKEKGKTASGLVDELVATRTKALDAAVDDGRITKEQAARLEEGLADRMEALVNGELRKRSPERHRFWPGSFQPRGPPQAFAPSA